MRWMKMLLILCTALPAIAATPSKPATQPILVSTTQPVAVPYKLTDTNHILIRLKINGKGPFNFIVDTGAPLMILRTSAADKLGLKPNALGFANLKTLGIEGGITLRRVQCLVDTPYQIEGMNAIGATGVDLDGMLGYSVLARFRIQIDLTKDRMIWTPVKFIPPPYELKRTSARAPDDPKEDHLEAVGGLLKFLGPLIKPGEVQSKYRGMIGLGLAETNGSVVVDRVLGDTPAENAGMAMGDRIISVNKTPVKTVTDAQTAMAGTLAGKPATVVVQRDAATITFHLICVEGL